MNAIEISVLCVASYIGARMGDALGYYMNVKYPIIMSLLGALAAWAGAFAAFEGIRL